MDFCTRDNREAFSNGREFSFHFSCFIKWTQTREKSLDFVKLEMNGIVCFQSRFLFVFGRIYLCDFFEAKLGAEATYWWPQKWQKRVRG